MAHVASAFTRAAHQRLPLMKSLVVTALIVAWVGLGIYGLFAPDRPISDVIYAVLGGITVTEDYADAGRQGNLALEVARFAGVSLTAVGLLFGFSGALGRMFARLFMRFASDHIIIAGNGFGALALARSCRKVGDSVVLVAQQLPEDTVSALRGLGIVLIEGDATTADLLRSVGAHRAAHVVAFHDDDAENLRIEAAIRSVMGKRRRSRPLSAHVAIGSPLLLQEAREMRMLAERERAAAPNAAKAAPPIDPKPFSLDELVARALVVTQGPEIIRLASEAGQDRAHLVLFGFDPTAESVAVRMLMSLWSVRFAPPRITVITADPDDARQHFQARYPQAMAHDVWRADIAFLGLDWTRASVDRHFLAAVEEQRGPVSAVVVSTGSDGANIQLSLGLMRTANLTNLWPVPIFMKETSASEFSRQFASGDRTPDIKDAYLQAFGAVEEIAVREYIIDAKLDRGAALAHQLYTNGMITQDVDMRQLEAVGRGWDAVPETYRNANRAVADSAVVKLQDAGWRPAVGKEPGDVHPRLDDALLERLAQTEHCRWVAERLLSGWRPGDQRNNALMIHPDIAPWDRLTPPVRERDFDQVRGAAKVARALHKRGFVRLPVIAPQSNAT